MTRYIYGNVRPAGYIIIFLVFCWLWRPGGSGSGRAKPDAVGNGGLRIWRCSNSGLRVGIGSASTGRGRRLQAGRGGGLRVSLPGETGDGGKPPSPSAPPPGAIATT